jgi:hypothetical protein
MERRHSPAVSPRAGKSQRATASEEEDNVGAMEERVSRGRLDDQSESGRKGYIFAA